MQDSIDVTTLVFLGLAVFVLWRLRTVLGQKTGTERPPLRSWRPKDASKTHEDGENVVQLRQSDKTAQSFDKKQGATAGGANEAKPDSLERLKRAEPGFDQNAFLDGANRAYETIVIAFAKGDRKTLKPLLSKDVADGFEGVIADRERKSLTSETIFVSINKTEIVGTNVTDKLAQITVRFLSNVINTTRDRAGNVVEGDPEAVVEVTDVWTFSRILGARDPNWQLVATDAAN